MSRRRSLSTEISLDPNVDELAQNAGDFAALLYTWMIPHADDSATISANPKRILGEVIPHRRDKTIADVQAAIEAMFALDLFEAIDRSEQVIYYPVESFYKYQSSIPQERRRTECAPDSAERHESPQNASSLSLSSSSSFSSSTAPKAARKVQAGEPEGFEEWWALYPKKQAKGAARKAYRAALKKAPAHSLLAALKGYSFSPEAQFIPFPASWLNAERWSDEAVPFTPDAEEFTQWGERG